MRGRAERINKAWLRSVSPFKHCNHGRRNTERLYHRRGKTTGNQNGQSGDGKSQVDMIW
jgi:hypothetical protein